MSWLEKEMATHSSTLAWKIPWTQEPGGLQCMGPQRVRYDWPISLHFTHFTSYFITGEGMATHSSFLSWRIPRTEEPGGPWSMGSQRVRQDWSDWAHFYLLICLLVFFFLILTFFLIFFLLYNIVLVLPYINMHPPRVYTYYPSWTPLPPPSPYHPSGKIIYHSLFLVWWFL